MSDRLFTDQRPEHPDKPHDPIGEWLAPKAPLTQEDRMTMNAADQAVKRMRQQLADGGSRDGGTTDATIPTIERPFDR